MRILLVTPPMTQLNTPYPATAYLTGFLKSEGVDVRQADLSLELALRLFSRTGLTEVAKVLKKNFKVSSSKVSQNRKNTKLPKSVKHFLQFEEAYLDSIDAVVSFLQGKDNSLAYRIVGRKFLPEGPQFAAVQSLTDISLSQESEADPLGWAFGTLGIVDRAKFFASLAISDIAMAVRDGVDDRFELARYAEKLAASQASFDYLDQALNNSHPTLIDRWIEELILEKVTEHAPHIVGFSTPFPGNVYAAFRMARAIKKKFPQIKTVLGGGWVNTELRDLKEPRVFDYFDFVSLDDGERPLINLIEFVDGRRPKEKLFRTFVREKGLVMLATNGADQDVAHKSMSTPSYAGLELSNYLSIFEMLNPMHRIWSDGRWNKLTLAHGCYWKKCSFCDVGLDYIGRFEPAAADVLVDRIVALKNETGAGGFHFVDEAAPPALLEALSQRLIERKVVITWWGNIRFEKSFTPKLCELMAKAGCVAISGGLEVASDRLLKLMNKGVTVDQVARVTKAFTDAGIMVHAYLMYGFPTQTLQETVDSLERVRQLFLWGCIQSAYWHRFAATAHSPIGIAPEKFGIKIKRPKNPKFAVNDLEFTDPTGVDHEALGVGLNKALYNFMHGLGLEEDVRVWFEELKVPKAKVSPDLIERALSQKIVRHIH